MKGDIEVEIKRNGKVLFTVKERSPEEARKKASWFIRNKLKDGKNTGAAASS